MWPIPYDNTGVTVELGELVENGVDMWSFDYPVPAATVTYNGKTAKVPFDKEALQQKIIDHYYFRQIGSETPGRWLHQFRTRMREIMPYYVQLYEFEAKWFNIDDPLESYNLRETFTEETEETGKASGSSTGTSTGSADKTTKFSDTPHGSIENLDSYLTEGTVEAGADTNTSTGQTSQNTEGTEKTTHTMERRGNIGVQPLGSEVTNIRSAFINIDAMVVAEFADLFLKVY